MQQKHILNGDNAYKNTIAKLQYTYIFDDVCEALKLLG